MVLPGTLQEVPGQARRIHVRLLQAPLALAPALPLRAGIACQLQRAHAEAIPAQRSGANPGTAQWQPGHPAPSGHSSSCVRDGARCWCVAECVKVCRQAVPVPGGSWRRLFMAQPLFIVPAATGYCWCGRCVARRCWMDSSCQCGGSLHDHPERAAPLPVLQAGQRAAASLPTAAMPCVNTGQCAAPSLPHCWPSLAVANREQYAAAAAGAEPERPPWESGGGLTGNRARRRRSHTRWESSL